MFLQNESWSVNESKWEWIWQAVGQGTWKLMLYFTQRVKLYNVEQRSGKDGRCKESRLWSGNQIKTGWKPCWGTGLDWAESQPSQPGICLGSGCSGEPACTCNLRTRTVSIVISRYCKQTEYWQVFLSSSITSCEGIQGEKWKQQQILFSWAPKSLQTVTAVMKLKDTCSLEGKLWQT